MASPVLVESGDEQHTVLPEDSLTFGRSPRCTIRLTPPDDGISRCAGALRCESGAWWLNNESDTRPFDVFDHLGFVHPLAPGARFALTGGRVEAVLTGLVHRFCVAITLPSTNGAPGPERRWTGNPTRGGHEVLITPKERLALIAMFAGHLQTFPTPQDEPTTYKQAGRRLGLPAGTVRKRVEHVRQKLTRAGVPGLWGTRATEHLATYVIATGIITADDLRLLPTS